MKRQRFRHLAAVLLLASSVAALGDVHPAGSVLPVIKSSSNMIKEVSTPDLDGDGRPDVLVCSHVMQLWRNLGRGVLESLPPITVTDDAVTADLDDDGLPEIISFYLPGVREQEATLPFGFGPVKVLQPDAQGQVCLITGDLNDDGKTDIVSTGLASARSWLNDGAGGLLPPIDAVGGPISGIQRTLGDVNADGELDLLALPSVLLGKGDGTFLEQPPLAGWDLALNARLADLDGDGLPDAVSNSQDSQDPLKKVTSVFHGNGDASFTLLASAPTGGSGSVLDVGDADGDGQPDVLAQVAGTNEIAAHRIVGTGLIALPGYSPMDSNLPHVVFADLEGDGRSGLVEAAEPGPPLLTIYVRGDGTGSLAIREILLPGPPLHDQLAADIDGDGQPEVVALRSAAQDELVVMKAPGDGTLAPPGPPTPVDSGMALASRLRLDSDARDDLLLTRNGEAQVYLSKGDGSFTPGPQVQYTGHSRIAAGDLDGDGDDDLVVLDTPGPVWYPSAGDGTLLPALPLIAPGLLTPTGMAVALADADADGVLDLFAGYVADPPFTDTLLYFRGLGQGTFEAAQSIGSDDAGCKVALRVGDIDSDGDLDVVGFGAVPNTPIAGRVTIVHGDGAGGFEPPSLIPMGSGPMDLVLADLNGDGRADLVVQDLHFDVSRLRLYALQLVDGGFTQPRSAVLGRTPFDLDGDGDDDLLDDEPASTQVGLYAELMVSTADFIDLGPGVAGGTGNALLHGTGPLHPGSPVVLNLAGCVPDAPCEVVVGTSSALQPPGSGAANQIEIGGLATDAFGALQIKGRWGSLPRGSALYVQAWITDPAAIGGLASSNAVQLAGD